MADSILSGSICLSNIPRDVMRKVICKDGKERIFLNVAVIEKKNPQTFTNNGVSRTYTHFITCSPKKEERIEGVNYIIGDLETRVFATNAPSAAIQNAAAMFGGTLEQVGPVEPFNPQSGGGDDLPF
jgi:hypothetical protein